MFTPSDPSLPLKHEGNFQDGYPFMYYNMYQPQLHMQQIQMPPMTVMPNSYFSQVSNNNVSFGENYTESPKVIITGSSKDYAPIIAEKEKRDETIDQVSGRLCLLSATRKHKVTLGEICRRISQPEGLHTSLINGILRNAKAKDNGQKLRSKLQNYDINLQQGRRKICKSTTFTAFTEGEARQLAEDFSMLCKERGGSDELGRAYVEEQIAKDIPLEQVMKENEVIKKFLDFLIRYHNANVTPDDMDYTNEAEKSVMTLSLLTHGFSHVALNGTVNYFRDMADAMQAEVLRRNNCQQRDDLMGQMARMAQQHQSFLSPEQHQNGSNGVPPGYFPPVNP